MIINEIPLERLAKFLASDLTCAVWWSPHDLAVIGAYVDCHADEIADAGEVRRMVSRRPAKCSATERTGWIGCAEACAHLCLGDVERAIRRCVSPDRIEWFTDYGHPTHPGDEVLESLKNKWAVEIGWLD